MKDFKNMSEAELSAVLAFTQALAARASFANADRVGDFSEPSEADIAEARKQAAEYAHAVNGGARSRTYNEADENAKDGVKSALDWLRRKQKSAIRKA